MNEWFYVKNGQRYGPIAESGMAAIMQSHDLDGETLVWQQGMAEWIPLSKTKLSTQLFERSIPPTLPEKKKGNIVVWILALAPLLGVFWEGVASGIVYGSYCVAEDTDTFDNQFWYVTVLFYIILGYWDAYNLRTSGVKTSGFGGFAWLTPVYLWKRAKALAQSPAYFWVWIVLFSFLLLARL